MGLANMLVTFITLPCTLVYDQYNTFMAWRQHNRTMEELRRVNRYSYEDVKGTY